MCIFVQLLIVMQKEREQQSSPELKRVVLVSSIEERQFVKWHEVVPQP